LSNETWGASPSPLVSDGAAGAAAGEGLALPSSSPPQGRKRVYVCVVESGEEPWLENELADYILGDTSWLDEVCYELRHRERIDLRDLPFKDAMLEARALLIQKDWKIIVIRDRAGARIIRLGKRARVLRRLKKLELELQAYSNIVGDRPRNLKRDKKDRKLGWAYQGAITFTVDKKKCGSRDRCARELKKEVSKFWDRFQKHYDTNISRVCVAELHESGYMHLHCIFYSSKPLPVERRRGIWRFSDKKSKWESWYKLGFIDAFALPKLKHAVNYLKKYLRKQLDNKRSNGSTASLDNYDSKCVEDGDRECGNWKGWEVEFSYVYRVKVVGSSRDISGEAKRIWESRILTKSKIKEIEDKKLGLPVYVLGKSYIRVNSVAVGLLAKVTRNYVLACERARDPKGVEEHIEHPSVQLYSDLIKILPNLEVSDPWSIRLYLLDLRRGLDPPVDLWQIMFQIWVIDSFTS